MSPSVFSSPSPEMRNENPKSCFSVPAVLSWICEVHTQSTHKNIHARHLSSDRQPWPQCVTLTQTRHICLNRAQIVLNRGRNLQSDIYWVNCTQAQLPSLLAWTSWGLPGNISNSLCPSGSSASLETGRECVVVAFTSQIGKHLCVHTTEITAREQQLPFWVLL